MSFLYVWQTIIIAPMSIASGAVGLALYYAKYFLPAMTTRRENVWRRALPPGDDSSLPRIRSVGRLS